MYTDVEHWAEVRRRVLTGEISKREACREYRLHWDTLQKILANEEPPGYLLQLCELELVDRERRAAERRLKAARFPTLKTLEDFDFAAQLSLNKVLVAELMRCEFVDRRESVILIGSPGTGKTHLATALAAEACRRGKKVRFWRVTELVT